MGILRTFDLYIKSSKQLPLLITLRVSTGAENMGGGAGGCFSDGGASFLSGGWGTPWGGALVLLGVGSKKIVEWGLELKS